MHPAHISDAIFNKETKWFVFVLWDKTASDPDSRLTLYVYS